MSGSKGVDGGVDEVDAVIAPVGETDTETEANKDMPPPQSEFAGLLGNVNEVTAEQIPDIVIGNKLAEELPAELLIPSEILLNSNPTATAEEECAITENQDDEGPTEIIPLQVESESNQDDIDQVTEKENQDHEENVKSSKSPDRDDEGKPDQPEEDENKSSPKPDEEKSKELGMGQEKSERELDLELDSPADDTKSQKTEEPDEKEPADEEPAEPDTKSVDPKVQSEVTLEEDSVNIKVEEDEEDDGDAAPVPVKDEGKQEADDDNEKLMEAVVKEEKLSVDENVDDKVKVKDEDGAEDLDEAPKEKKPRKVGPRKVILKKVRQIRKSKRVLKKKQLSGKDKDGHEVSFTNVMDEEHSALYLKPEILQSTKETHNGTLYKIGDVISIIGEDGQTYYAQLKYFLGNKFCQRFVAIRWLLPSTSLPHPPPQYERVEGFHPDLYCQGPDQLEPVNMDHIRFVMHLPSIYSSEKGPFVHQEEHGLTHMNLPTTGPRIEGLGLLHSTKTSTSI